MARVLLVEDEPGLRDLVAEGLADCGHIPTVAEDGTQALIQLAEGAFDVVVSDISMPGGISGIDLVEHMRAHGLGGRIILVSGHAKAQLPPLPASVEFLPKPYRFQQLLNLIARH